MNASDPRPGSRLAHRPWPPASRRRPCPGRPPARRVLTQPPGEGAGLPVAGHVDGLAGIHIDQQGRIRVPASFREIIHAQHGNLPDLGIGQRPHQLDQRVPADLYSQQPKQPGSGPPGQRQRDQLQQPAQQHRPAGKPLGKPGYRLSERPHPARWILASQTADRERDQDPAAPCGQIMQKPAIVSVHSGGGHAASPARRRSSRRTRRHQHVIPAIGHLIDGQSRQVREEHLQAAGIARRDMLHTGHNEPHGRSDNDQVLGRTRSSQGGRAHARAVPRLPPLPDKAVPTVSNRTTQKSPDPGKWPGIFGAIWRECEPVSVLPPGR
jgi:hypothetical protein